MKCCKQYVPCLDCGGRGYIYLLYMRDSKPILCRNCKGTGKLKVIGT